MGFIIFRSDILEMKSSPISWGRFPKHECELEYFDKTKIFKHKEFLPFGNGRSYGDSCMANKLIDMKNLNKFIHFDDRNGILIVQAGVMLNEIIDVIIPKGWFLKTNPGTKLITIGGAIAADIHGKNHHKEGCFSECVKWFKLIISNEDEIICSRDKNIDYFHATCGGMGLTGLITEVKIELKRINSINISQTTIKTKNLIETFEVFESIKHEPYSVAWIDCLAKKNNIGRSKIIFGDFLNDGNFNIKNKRKISVPFEFPTFFLNSISVKIFNWLYYNFQLNKVKKNIVDYDTFFFPLDKILKWNKIYGKNGFTQYQFILPKENSFEGLKEILETISKSGKGSFLAVLKLYGRENKNWLSFPIEGYSLALDFKIENRLFTRLKDLDDIVVKYKGRIYLAKDARVSKEIFEVGYPNIENFRAFRKKTGLNKKFNSLQSLRLEI